MNKKDVKVWTKALRSGEYEQCSNYLHSNGGFCCLGVAIDVLVEGDWKPNGNDYINRYTFDGDSQHLTNKTLNKIGLSSDIAEKLAGFNDDGKSFKWIASWIERNAHRPDE